MPAPDPKLINIEGSRKLHEACINLAQALCENFPQLAQDIMAGSTISVVTSSRKTIRLPVQIQNINAQIVIPHGNDLPGIIKRQGLDGFMGNGRKP